MASKRLTFSVLLLLFAVIIGRSEADWKFWKSKTTTTTTTTTAAPPIPSPVPVPNQNSNSKPNVNSAIASAGNPSLAVGAGISSNVANNNPNNGGVQDRNRPRPPNPGTEVGLDISRPKPNPPGIAAKPGQKYSDWAADLTGAGTYPGNQPPQLPSSGPALAPGQPPQPIPAGNKPGQVAPQAPRAQGPVPTSAPVPNRPGSPTPSQPPNVQPVPNKPSVPSPSPSNPSQIPSRPIANGPANGPIGQRPPQPSVAIPTTPTSPGGKSWAEVAGGSGSRSPTPAPRPGSVNPSVPSRPGSNTAAIGAAAVGAAGAAAVAASGGPKKVYSGNPTFSKGNTVTDDDLEKLSEALYIKDVNNAYKHIRINLQKQTSSSSPKDEAPEPLLTVNAAAHQIPTIEKVISIYDNYQLDTKTNEYISPAQRQEESLLVDTFLSTNVMSFAMRFLADKGFVRKDYYEYKDTLRRLWFNLYSRGDGKIGSSGFEHVFLTETKLGTEVSGLHNWIYFNAEEVKKRADYLGYIKKVDLGENAALIKLHAKFNGIDKPVTTMFIGTSPELEMALYTVCFFARPDSSCPVSLGGTKFNIITHKFKYRGNDLIGSAYPEL